MANTLFITTDYLKQNSIINDNVDDELLIPAIIKSQDLYIERILGSDLMNRLKTDIEGSAGQVSGNYKILLDDHVQKTLREWATYEAVVNGNFKFTNKSIAKKSSENSVPSEINELVWLRNQIRDTAEFYSERITKYLCANKSLFPEYTANNDSDDINASKQNYFNGISLEPDYMTRKNYNNGIGYYNEPDCDCD